MITYKITGDNVPMTEADQAYVEKRFQRFDRFIKGDYPKEMTVTVRKMIAHERDNAFKVEVAFSPAEENYFVSTEQKDFHTAVDVANNELWREITGQKGRKDTLFHRGARRLKELLKRGSRG
jgi:ribosomal subunit interface protein